MKESLQTIIESLVDDKNSIEIKETANEKSVIFEVKVASQDMGKVIGREGKIARSIRTIMKALGAKEDKRVNVEFID